MGLPASAIAINVRNAGANLVGAHSSGVGSLVLSNVFAFGQSGQVVVGGDVYTFTALDDEANTITLSGTTSAAYDDDQRVELYPVQPVYYATVRVGSDQSGVNALVPHSLVPLLSEQMLDEPAAIPVVIEQANVAGFQWIVSEVPGRSAVHDANQAPVIVTNDDGESVRLDADGYQSFTDNPVVISRFPVAVIDVDFSSDGTNAFWASQTHPVAPSATISRFDLSAGEMVTSGWPLAVGTDIPVFVSDGTHLYVVSSPVTTIRKYTISTGAQVVTGGWPKAVAGAQFSTHPVVDGGYVFLKDDNSGDVRKFATSDGTEDTSGNWPLALAAVTGIGAGDGFLYVGSGGPGDEVVEKYLTSDGSAVSGWSIDTPNSRIAANEDHVYVYDGGIRKFDAVTMEETVGSGWPHATSSDLYDVTATQMHTADTADILVLNLSDGYLSTSIDSETGQIDGHFANLVEASIRTLIDDTRIPSLLVYTTKGRKTATQSIPNATATVVTPYGAFNGSGTSGATAFWSHSAGVFTILVDGVYDLGAYADFATNAAGGRLAELQVNGAFICRDTRVPGSGAASYITLAAPGVPLVAGDTIRLLVVQSSGGALNLAVGSYLSIKRCGALAP